MNHRRSVPRLRQFVLLLCCALLPPAFAADAATASPASGELPVATPEGVTIASVTRAEQRYEIVGNALSASRIAGYLADLERSPELDQVELRESRVEQRDGIATMSFIISARAAPAR
jgi:Tfp pilus assembly protein PilN